MSLDWTKLGHELRESAIDAFGPDDKPDVHSAYTFLLDNPECFIDAEDWPDGIPAEPNVELIAAYYGAV